MLNLSFQRKRSYFGEINIWNNSEANNLISRKITKPFYIKQYEKEFFVSSLDSDCNAVNE
jgi:hypothetical protein